MEPGASQSLVSEVKLADGIYFTDYRNKQPVVNNCQGAFMKKKDDLPKHPELLIALFKESDNKVSKLVYSINGNLPEIKGMENYKEDEDFVSAIVEDYQVILKTLDYEVAILEELEKLDCFNPFLKKHPVADLKEMIRKYTEENLQFTNEIEASKKAVQTDENTQNTNNDQKMNPEDDKNSVFI